MSHRLKAELQTPERCQLPARCANVGSHGIANRGEDAGLPQLTGELIAPRTIRSLPATAVGNRIVGN
jgi:hypothetical protein